MAKKLMSFRFSVASQERLAALSVEWDVSATAVLERLLLEIDPEFHARARSVGKTAALEGVQQVLEAKVDVPVEPPRPRVKFRSQVADPDKLAAFQRGMGKKK